jgi:hypothetical protein
VAENFSETKVSEDQIADEHHERKRKAYDADYEYDPKYPILAGA